MSFKGVFFFFFFFFFLALVAILFSEQNHFSNFNTGSPKKHFYELFRNRANVLEDVVSKFSIFSFGSHFVQWSKTILIIMVEGHPRNISVKLF